MTVHRRTIPLRRASVLIAGFFILLLFDGRSEPAKTGDAASAALEEAFGIDVRPFLDRNCIQCHNEDLATAGVRLDRLDAKLEDSTLHLWEIVERRVGDGSMPPEGVPEPSDEERQRMVGWVGRALEFARLRPVPKNGIVRRLTVAQYRNTLRELLHLRDNLTSALPPDAISEDGFVNNAATLDLSPLLMESYFRVAEDALDRAIVDPDLHPSIQRFRMELGESVNPNPIPDKLILGALSHLLDNEDFVVTQVPPSKPFVFEPFRMRTKFRFIEGYQGNATVRGWKEYDSIYHAVFACMRGSRGYPKGSPYETVPEGLLLRPAIPSDELFGIDSTYGPKANFKISLRELPDYGHFRVTVEAAKYDDALLLDSGTPTRSADEPGAVEILDPLGSQTVALRQGGVYQVDVYEGQRAPPPPADMSGLEESLAGHWPLDGETAARLEGGARFVGSPFGQAVALDGEDDWLVVSRGKDISVGEGDFTIAAWVRPSKLRNAGILARGAPEYVHGWYLDMPDNKGRLRLETTNRDTEPNGTVVSPEGVLRGGAWQHVAAVVRRGEDQARLYVNGYAVARGTIGPADLDNPELDLHLGRIPEGTQFPGGLDEVRLYRRALDEAEIQGLVEPGRSLAKPPLDRPQEVTLTLDGRQFTATLERPAVLAARFDAGDVRVELAHTGVKGIDRIVLTPLGSEDAVARRFLAFEKRVPRVGVHLGLRRDCGSTLAAVGPPQAVRGEKLSKHVFEGAIRDFPSPDVEKNNVNYLAGIREIGVRSEYTDGRDMPRLVLRSVEFEGPLYETWPPASHRSIFIEFDRKDDLPAYARAILRDFASRAFRRAATADEVSALMAVYEASFEDGGNFRESVRDALQVALTSPQFLFIVESSSTPEPEAIEDYELAPKLSYFLWNGPPDQRTLELADAGQLRHRLDEEVSRMIEDSKFERFVGQFASQWLSLDKLDVLEPDKERFPKLTYHARSHLRQEPVALLRHLFRNNLPARNLVESDFVLANEVVAGYYDMPDLTEGGFEFRPIRHERPELGGLLTQAAIMAGLSDGRESNPVKRGAWLARKIVAEPPDDPPPNVPDLEQSTEGLPLRERLELHRSQPGCMQCHLKIDPWGVPFEEFDAGGRLKDVRVDATSTLPDGTEVTGVEDLKAYLARDRIDQVAFSVLKHLTTYANGRSLAYSELDYLKRDVLGLRGSGYRMQDMLRYVVSSKLFLEK